MSDDERDIRSDRSMREQQIHGGSNRRYFIFRLLRMNQRELAAQVIQP
jgi:hypothetical protein